GREWPIGAPRTAEPFDGRLHRPRLGRPRHARALERRQPPDHDLPRDEDRPALVRAALRAGLRSLRVEGARLEVPGPEGPDAEPLLEELRRMILVTGGTGFVGPKVVHALRAQQKEVRCLVRKPARAETLKAWGCDLVTGDMT